MMNLSVKFRAKGLNLGRNLKNLKNFKIFFKFLNLALDEQICVSA